MLDPWDHEVRMSRTSRMRMIIQNVLSSTRGKLTRGKEKTVQPSSEEDEREYPLEMPCGHVFGSTCLKAWLYQSPTCPLCRVEVESYTDEPQQPEISPLDGQLPFLRVPPVENNKNNNLTKCKSILL